MTWAKPLLKKLGIKANGARVKGYERTVKNGEAFPSKLEADVHQQLLLMERGGLIRDIERQRSVHLAGNLKFKIDFVVFDIERNKELGIEAKGFETERWKVICQVWPDLGPFPMQVWARSRNGAVFVLKEIQGGK